MIVPKMRSADMPVEVLGLHVEREHVGEERIQRTGDVPARVVAQIGGGGDWRLAAVLCSRFLGHGENLFLKSHDRGVLKSGLREAIATPGDLLFHIRAKRMDL